MEFKRFDQSEPLQPDRAVRPEVGTSVIFAQSTEKGILLIPDLE